MELRTKLARATKDIDLNLRFATKQQDDSAEEIRDKLVRDLSYDLQDNFGFLVGAPTMDLEAAPYGGARYPIESIVDEKTFVKFSLDVAIGDHSDEALEQIEGRDWLQFAGIRRPTFLAIRKEQQFAEKIHAYTRPRQGIQNSRVKDLVDLVLLIESNSLHGEKVQRAIQSTFYRRKSHDMPDALPLPPPNWEVRFKKLSAECSISLSLEGAYRLVEGYLASIKKVVLK